MWNNLLKNILDELKLSLLFRYSSVVKVQVLESLQNASSWVILSVFSRNMTSLVFVFVCFLATMALAKGKLNCLTQTTWIFDYVLENLLS